MKPGYVYLVAFGIVVSIIGYTKYIVINYPDLSFASIAILILCCAIAINSTVQSVLKWITETFVVFATSNVLDEFFFNPEKIESNEYVFALFALIYQFKTRKRWIKSAT